MDASWKKLQKEMKKGTDMELYLPRFTECLAEKYYEFSMIQFTFNYYTLYESITTEKDLEVVKYLDHVLQTVHQILKDKVLDGSSDVQEAVKVMHDLRQELIGDVDALSAYADSYTIFEYAYNRMDSNYENVEQFEEDEELKERISNFVFDSNDNFVINERIKNILSQLPVRMTRGRYLEMMHESFKVYKEANMSAFNAYLYLLRTSSGIYKPAESKQKFIQDLKVLIQEIEGLSTKELDADKVKHYSELIAEKGAFIQEAVDTYELVMKLVNQLYTMLLTIPYLKSAGTVTEEASKMILTEVHKSFVNGTELSKKTAEWLPELEGRQEELYEEYAPLEGYIEECKLRYHELIEKEKLGDIFHILSRCSHLVSTSGFVDLDEEPEVDGPVEEAFFEEKRKEFLEELSGKLNAMDSRLRKGMIANTLCVVPVFFNDRLGFEAYVMNSLMQCSDNAEKNVSIELVREAMTW